MLKKIIGVFLLLVSTGICKGQDYSENTQYIYNPMRINPAFAGENEALNLSLFYGRKWIGIKEAPESMVLSVDAPFFKQKLGVGLMFVSDQYESSRENQLTSHYAYKVRMPHSVLSIGVGAHLLLTELAYRDLISFDRGLEDSLLRGKNYLIPNFSFGVHYTMKNYFVGVSIPELLSPAFDETKDQYMIENDFSNYNYLLHSGYTFKMIRKFYIHPSVLFQYTSKDQAENFKYDVNTLLSYDDRFWLGASYRNERLFAALLQIYPTKQWSIAYSYNFDIGQAKTYRSESHEIMLRYVFKYKIDAPNPLIF